MPDIRNCKRCGRVYNYLGGNPICPDCKKNDEDDFKRVKEFLYKNSGASLSEVSTELDISVEKIKRFLKEGRLEIIGEEGNMVLECETCGKAIKTGRFCDDCSKNVSNNLKSVATQITHDISVAEDEKSKNTFGLRYLNKDLKK